MTEMRNPKRYSSVLRLRNALRIGKAVSFYDQLETNHFSQSIDDISLGLLKVEICAGFCPPRIRQSAWRMAYWDLGFVEKYAVGRFIGHKIRSQL